MGYFGPFACVGAAAAPSDISINAKQHKILTKERKEEEKRTVKKKEKGGQRERDRAAGTARRQEAGPGTGTRPPGRTGRREDTDA